MPIFIYKTANVEKNKVRLHLSVRMEGREKVNDVIISNKYIKKYNIVLF